jgi:hypothetical protein
MQLIDASASLPRHAYVEHRVEHMAPDCNGFHADARNTVRMLECIDICFCLDYLL